MPKLTDDQRSAFQIVDDILKQYGLGDLSRFVRDTIVGSDSIDTASLWMQIKEQPAYQARFAGNEARRKAGLNVLTEDEYLRLESDYARLLRSAGLPASFYDQPSDFAAFIGGDVSVSELNSRINAGYLAVQQADPEVVSQMRTLYGVEEGQLAAFFLDPDRAAPSIVRKAQAAQIAAQARLQAGEQLTRQEAELFARQGVTVEQAQAGFGVLTEAKELFTPTITEKDEFSRSEQFGAVLGTSAGAQQRLRKRQRERQAQFQTGGQFTTSQTGKSALA